MKNLAIIIVTYNPTADLLENVAAAQNQAETIIIVDNGSRAGQDILLNLQTQKSVLLVRNEFNLGIATALNQGVEKALDGGADWIMTLDQDTTLSDDAIAAMFFAYANHPHPEKVGIIAPIHIDKSTGYKSRYIRAMRGPYASREIVISSGNLIPRSTFKNVGPYDDDLFIDYVDHDFCLKVRKAGLEIIVVKDAKMAHSLGVIRQHRYGPLFFFSHNYLPVRRYYQARNRLILYRRHFGRWIFQDQEFAVKEMIKTLLVERNKLQKIKATILGIIDGLLSRMGDFEGATYSTPKAQKYFIEFREEIVPLLPEGRSEKVMDLGCGSGQTAGFLKEKGRFAWVCGVEGSPDAAAVARQRMDLVLEGDIEKIEYPFPGESFDIILALDILEHLVDPWTTVRKLHSLLKPGGRLIVSIPNVRHYSVVFPLLFLGDWRYTQEGLLDSTHIRFFTRKTALKLFLAQGFSIECMDQTGGKKGFGSMINKLTLGIFKEFFIFQHLFAFKK